jgi:Protein kinase domain
MESDDRKEESGTAFAKYDNGNANLKCDDDCDDQANTSSNEKCVDNTVEEDSTDREDKLRQAERTGNNTRPLKRQKATNTQFPTTPNNAMKTPEITSDYAPSPSVTSLLDIDDTETKYHEKAEIDSSQYHQSLTFHDKRSSHSCDSNLSDVSSASASTDHRAANLSPLPQGDFYLPYLDVPPAPPSTPASSGRSTFSSIDSCIATPIPILTRGNLVNANNLERQQQLYDDFAAGAETPAPTKNSTTPAASTASSSFSSHASASSGGYDPATAMTPTPADRKKPSTSKSLPEDFSDWAVGDRYKLIRMLGRGSYGEVAQALDLYAGRDDAYVAIKRIQSPFDQEVDSIRLYREIHILRRIRGHSCVIQLLNVVQPPTDDLDDFHDLYLVFECKDSLELG